MEETRLTSPEFLKDFSEVDRWLSSRGFNKRDRFRRFKRDIEQTAEWERRSSPEEIFREVKASGRDSQLLTAFTESAEFVRTLKTLISKGVAVPDELLGRVLDGPWDAVLEDDRSNQGRNATFELVMGAVAAHKNLQPILGQANPDVEFRFRDRRILLECKRILSLNGLIPNVSGAIRQLDKCVQADSGEIGLVAVSVSRLAHQGKGYFDVPSEAVAREFLFGGLRQMVADFEKKLAELSRPSVAGIIFYISCPFYIQNQGFTVLTQGILYPTNTASQGLIRDLIDILRI